MNVETVGFSEALASFYQSVPGDTPRKAVILVFAKNVGGWGGGQIATVEFRVFCLPLSDLNTARGFPSSLYECDWIPHFKRGAHILSAREEGAEYPA
jgi:hypothetical protein